MTTLQFKIYRLMLAAVVVALNVLPVSAADVVVQTVVAPATRVVRLGDVAKIKCQDAKEAERLRAISLLPAPAPGRKRFVRMREIQDMLAAQGEDMSKLNFSGELMIEIAPPVEKAVAKQESVDRRAVWAGTSAVVATGMTAVPESLLPKPAAVRLTAAEENEARNYVEQAVLEHLKRNSERKAEWQVAATVSTADLAKVLAAKSALQCSGGVSPWVGQQNMVVAFRTERGPVRVRFVVDVNASQPVVVATRPISPGQIITAADVAVEQVSEAPKETLRRKVLVSLDSLLGMEATRQIHEGDAVYSDDFRAQLLVKKGDEIMVFARGGGIQVRTVARARQDGAKGELIGVESLEAKEPFEAVVSGPREAVVFTASAPPTKEKVAETPFRRLRQK
jgi:flagella basal body P-ring formation protein FlgA